MNDPTKSSKTRTLVATGVVALLTLPLAARYAMAGQSKPDAAPAMSTTVYTDQETVTDKAGWNAPDQAESAAHQGRMLLRQMQDVQTALETGDVDGARHALKAAKDFANTLKPLMPYQVVSDKIDDGSGKPVGSGTDVSVDQMLPISADVATVTAYVPAPKGKADTKAQAKAQTNGDKPIGTDVDTATLYLPVLYFENQIDLASRALDQSPKDTTLASQAVDDALNSLVFSQTDVHLLPASKGVSTS